jgi:dihydroflavonol-4-reductase
MTAVITGASGHIGANLVRVLLAQGQKVRALVHSDVRALEGLDVECVKGDVASLDDLYKAFANADVVYHLASYVSIQSNEWSQFNINVTGTRQVIAASRACGVKRLVHFSSIHALQKEPLDQVLDEERPLVDSNSRSPYDRSKAASERLVRQAIAEGIDAIIINPTAVIGPHDFKPSHIGQVLQALARQRLPILVEGGFDWVDARDVAAAAVKAAAVAPPGARYLLPGQWVSVRDLARNVSKLTSVPPPLLVCPMGLAKMAAPVATLIARLLGQRPVFTSISLEVLLSHRHISQVRAAHDLGYQPRPFETTIADTLQWFIDTWQLAHQFVLPARLAQ